MILAFYMIFSSGGNKKYCPVTSPAPATMTKVAPVCSPCGQVQYKAVPVTSQTYTMPNVVTVPEYVPKPNIKGTQVIEYKTETPATIVTPVSIEQGTTIIKPVTYAPNSIPSGNVVTYE